MELKISFIIYFIISGFFEWQKQNIAKVTLYKQVLHADE